MIFHVFTMTFILTFISTLILQLWGVLYCSFQNAYVTDMRIFSKLIIIHHFVAPLMA